MAPAGPPAFEQTELETHNGSQLLTWTGGEEPFEMQQSLDADFTDTRVAYTGAMPSAHVSGLRDGTYYFRVRTQDTEAWSEPATVQVTHHPMTLVWPLLSLGGVVFFAIAFYSLRYALAPKGTR